MRASSSPLSDVVRDLRHAISGISANAMLMRRRRPPVDGGGGVVGGADGNGHPWTTVMHNGTFGIDSNIPPDCFDPTISPQQQQHDDDHAPVVEDDDEHAPVGAVAACREIQEGSCCDDCESAASIDDCDNNGMAVDVPSRPSQPSQAPLHQMHHPLHPRAGQHHGMYACTGLHARVLNHPRGETAMWLMQASCYVAWTVVGVALVASQLAMHHHNAPDVVSSPPPPPPPPPSCYCDDLMQPVWSLVRALRSILITSEA